MPVLPRTASCSPAPKSTMCGPRLGGARGRVLRIHSAMASEGTFSELSEPEVRKPLELSFVRWENHSKLNLQAELSAAAGVDAYWNPGGEGAANVPVASNVQLRCAQRPRQRRKQMCVGSLIHFTLVKEHLSSSGNQWRG